ncbi:MAG: ThuA domain-containing protein [Planctomycetaceae bacterium]|nr:ThuA domain-containing protein [Planctomycetaceae bacterium]
MAIKMRSAMDCIARSFRQLGDPMLSLRCTFVFFFLNAIFANTVLFAAENELPHIVMLIAEREYATEESLTAFAKERLQEFRVTSVVAAANDRNSLVGTDAIESADLLIISVRRRTLPKDQLDRVRRYVAAGKPVIGIRTASHAFSLRGKETPEGRAVWPEFDSQVFGGNYANHHGNSLKTTIDLAKRPVVTNSPVIEGLAPALPASSQGSLYRVSPVAETADVLLIGRVQGAKPEPVAWTYRRGDGGKSFYTSLGHRDDFRGKVLPSLLANAIDWALTP